MPAVIVRNLSAATHRALKLRAKQHGQSTEAEIRAILDSAVNPPERVRLGSRLAEIGRQLGGVEFQTERDRTPARIVSFE